MKRPVINAPIERARSMAKPHHAIITFGNFLISDSFLPPGQTRAGEFMKKARQPYLCSHQAQATNQQPPPFPCAHTHIHLTLIYTRCRPPAFVSPVPSVPAPSINRSFLPTSEVPLSSCCTLDRPSCSRSTLHSFGSVNAFLSRFSRSFVAIDLLLSLKTHHFNPLLFRFS